MSADLIPTHFIVAETESQSFFLYSRPTSFNLSHDIRMRYVNWDPITRYEHIIITGTRDTDPEWPLYPRHLQKILKSISQTAYPMQTYKVSTYCTVRVIRDGNIEFHFDKPTVYPWQILVDPDKLLAGLQLIYPEILEP